VLALSPPQCRQLIFIRSAQSRKQNLFGADSEKQKTQQSLFTCATKKPPIDAGECSGDEIKKRATLTNVCSAIQVM
jgi:hypothetical protein